MYTEKLIDEYKSAMNYVQYKQVAHDLGISTQMLTDIRKGRAYLKENIALYIAEKIGENKEAVLIGLAADKAKSPEEQAIWSAITKKYNGLGITINTIACMGFVALLQNSTECALSILC